MTFMVAVFHPCSQSGSSLFVIGVERPLSSDGCFNGGGSHGDGEGERRSGETRGSKRLGENATALGQHGECITLYNHTHSVAQNTSLPSTRSHSEHAEHIRAKWSIQAWQTWLKHHSISSSYKYTYVSYTIHTFLTHPSSYKINTAMYDGKQDNKQVARSDSSNFLFLKWKPARNIGVGKVINEFVK